MPKSDLISDRRRQQNRDAQRTYRKSLLKRIEELENRQGLGVSDLQADNTQSQCPPSLARSQLVHTSIDEGQPSISTALAKELPTHSNEHDSPLLQYSIFSNEQLPSFSPHVFLDYRSNNIPSNESLSMYPDFEKTVTPKIQKPSSLKRHDTPPAHIATSSPPPPPATASGGTALHAAIMSGNDAIVKLLLERKADLTALTQEGKNALHLAVESGQANIVRMVLQAGAHVDSVDECGHTVLYKAIVNGSEEIACLLLDSGANVNQLLVFTPVTPPSSGF